MDGSPGNRQPTHPPAFPLDFRHARILLEARRHASPAKVRHAWLDRPAKHLRISARAAADFPDHRPHVLWLAAALGPGAVPCHAAASTMDHLGRGEIGLLFPGLYAH